MNQWIVLLLVLAFVEALIEQRHDLAPLRVFVGMSFSGLFRPEHADAFEFIGFGGAGRTAALTKAGVARRKGRRG